MSLRSRLPHALVLSLAVLAGPVGTARADAPGADWMPADQVIQKLTAAGYSSVSELEADDGRWEGKGVKDGRTVEFRADPRSGALLDEKRDD